ncbi:hypothetical protein JCM15765_39370 [Paradesulfitobacterium aromaticivorans]
MRNWTKLVIVLLIITNLIFIGTTVFYKDKIDNQVLKVYTFEGAGNDIQLSNGIIIISSGKQIVNGGQIQYIGNKLENIKSYSKTIYLDKQGSKDPVLSNSVSNTTGIPGMTFPEELLLNKDVGQLSGEKLFNDKNISSIKDNLYFSLKCISEYGKDEDFVVKLNVKEIL